MHLRPSNRCALNFSHPDRHFPEHQHSGRQHHLEFQRHGSKGRPSRTHTSHPEEEAAKPPASSLLLGFPDTDYPLHGKTIVVTRCGRICLDKKTINFSQVFARQAVGIKEVHDDIWLVSFMDYDLGYFDLETRVLEPLENPLGRKVTYVLGTLCNPCLRAGPSETRNSLIDA